MNRLLTFLCFATLTGLVFSGRYPGGADFTSDYDVVYTNYDKQYNFQDKGTYAMPDKIVVDLTIDNKGDTTIEYMKDIYAQPILQKIAENMANLGWNRVDEGANPDVLLTPAGLSSTTYFYTYWYDWWYGGYWGGWYGWYYPPYYSVSSITTGSLIMVIADPHVDSPINRSPASWLGVGNGVLTGGADISRVLTSIDQAFDQSPYLKTN